MASADFPAPREESGTLEHIPAQRAGIMHWAGSWPQVDLARPDISPAVEAPSRDDPSTRALMEYDTRQEPRRQAIARLGDDYLMGEGDHLARRRVALWLLEEDPG